MLLHNKTTQRIYPSLSNGENFRLTKISDFEKEISDEVEHYRTVAKKYKKAHSVVNGFAVGLGSIAAGLSTAGLTTAISGVGILATIPLASIAALFGFSSAGLTAFGKKLQTKVTKHEKICTLAITKKNSALADNEISDGEFNIVVREVQKYHELKAAIRSGALTKPSQNIKELAPLPDLEKIKKEIREQVRSEFTKNLQPCPVQI
ncbi:hypothetical protein OS493_017533 [Desmophyllum pertusum]|uniref:Uncharacterized protein n=1 Tax=Desmophyllum pertusum TaxID=174260 RepID=A0A9W9ZNW2_9CNID|nr:hypothetical protein OS493_017533 [Desmophyllum pertusum]